MKHHYNDTTLQAAIDCALEKVDTNSGSLVSRFHYPNTFKSEAPARLALLKSVLARLPDPPPPTSDGKTPEQTYHEIRIHDGNDGWPRREPVIEGVDWKARHDELQKEYATHADVTAALHARAEKAEAELEPVVTKPISLPEWTPKVGDAVTLRSGGPKMTVMRSTDSECRVIWFHDGVPRECDFLISTLTLA